MNQKKIKEILHHQEAFQYISGVLHPIPKFRFSFQFFFSFPFFPIEHNKSIWKHTDWTLATLLKMNSFSDTSLEYYFLCILKGFFYHFQKIVRKSFFRTSQDSCFLINNSMLLCKLKNHVKLKRYICTDVLLMQYQCQGILPSSFFFILFFFLRTSSDGYFWCRLFWFCLFLLQFDFNSFHYNDQIAG